MELRMYHDFASFSSSPGKPEKRMQGAFGYLGFFTLLGCSVYTGVKMIGWAWMAKENISITVTKEDLLQPNSRKSRNKTFCVNESKIRLPCAIYWQIALRILTIYWNQILSIFHEYHWNPCKDGGSNISRLIVLNFTRCIIISFLLDWQLYYLDLLLKHCEIKTICILQIKNKQHWKKLAESETKL